MYSNPIDLDSVTVEKHNSNYNVESTLMDFVQNRPESNTPMFELFQQPNVQQRKSYKSENRSFSFLFFLTN